MKITLTIDGQPIVLTAKQAAALFGKDRLREFAEGRWTPFVFCEPYRDPAGPDPTVTSVDITNMNSEEISEVLRDFAPDAFTLADDVMAAADHNE